MLKRIFLGVLALIAIAVVVIIVAFLRFDIPRDELIAKYGSDTSQFIETRSGAVAHVRDEGNPDGEVIVLVHGSNASLHTWEPWVALLGDTYRVVTLDMPAHGLTGATPEEDYSVTAMAAFTREVVRKLGIETFTLGGNSMGGAVALNYAVAYPEDLEGLILVCAAGIAREETETSEGDAARSFSLVSMPVVSQALRWLTPRFLFEDGLKGVFVDQSIVTDAMVDRYIELNVMAGTRDATRQRFATPRVSVPDDTVRGLEVPTLVMWGDKDPLIPVSVGERFDSLLPESTLVVYENVGHIPMEEVAEVSASDVRAFMETQVAAAAAPVPAALPDLEATVTVEDDGSLTIETGTDGAAETSGGSAVEDTPAAAE